MSCAFFGDWVYIILVEMFSWHNIYFGFCFLSVCWIHPDLSFISTHCFIFACFISQIKKDLENCKQRPYTCRTCSMFMFYIRIFHLSVRFVSGISKYRHKTFLVWKIAKTWNYFDFVTLWWLNYVMMIWANSNWKFGISFNRADTVFTFN